jgi:hypothetical protein
MSDGDTIDVIICTNSVATSSFRRVLSSLAQQKPVQGRWKLILVLNGDASNAAIDMAVPFSIEIFRLSEPGLNKARLFAFNQSSADRLVLLDDDTEIAGDYLAEAEYYFNSHRELGAGGGINVAEVEGGCPSWLEPCLSNLAIRDYGPATIAARSREFGPGIPVGAGMILRRAVAMRFIALFEKSLSQEQFGRKPGSLQGGEDTILAFCAFDVGLRCYYFPTLRLVHIISRERVSRLYIAKLNFALGCSHARVCEAIGHKVARSSWLKVTWLLGKHLRVLRQSYPQAALLLWLWYLGFAFEAKAFWKFEQ